ncbi:MAG: cation transporter [Calditrichaeota bacterium]|nr:cation transporter [Calditrichota bacterium]
MTVRRVRSEIPDTHIKRLYRKAILIAISGNILLALGKAFVAWISDSSAVFSDAANSFSDSLYSILMGIGLYLSQRPADENHPQGHGRFEPFVSLIIAIGMTGAGVTAVWQAIQRFLGQAIIIQPGWPTAILICAAIIKVAMYLSVRDIGNKSYSPAIRASAQDNLADILTSLAALAGVWGSRLIHSSLDPVAGVIVGLWIFRVTWVTIRENLGYLAGRGASDELTQKIVDVAYEVEGVQKVHRVVADYVGQRVRVEMHIYVDGEIPLKDAHEIGEAVKDKVEALLEVDLAFIHVEPPT